MKELILNVLATIIFFAALYIIIFGIGGVFHKTFFKNERN